MASAVPAAKASLLAIVQTAVATLTDSVTQVTWGYPGQLVRKECVWLDDATGTETSSIHQVSHRETFIIPIVVLVKADGDDHQAAEVRAWAITAKIEDAVRATPSLSATPGVTAAVVTSKTPVGHVADQARAVSITLDVTVTSRY